MLMDPRPSQQRACPQHIVLQLQQEVASSQSYQDFSIIIYNSRVVIQSSL